MKKNIMRVISLVIVATMVFAFCSCKQEVLVRFVDKDGNDINIAGLVGGNDAQAPADTPNGTPADTPNGTPADTPNDTPADTPNDTPADTPNDTPADTPNDTPADKPTEKPVETPTEKPAENPSSNAPQGKEAVFNFYKDAVAKVKGGAAGYTKQEWQAISSLKLTGIALADNAIANIAGNYMTPKEKAEKQVCEKGSDKAKDRFPNCTLTDMSKVKSATCAVQSNGNYKITIVMADENTPKKAGNFLGKVTNSILYWEDIDAELKKISAIKSYSNIQVIYTGFKITAEITPDGKFVSLDHRANVDIKIGSAKVLIAPLNNKSGHLDNFCEYRSFKY